ncbi:MAG: 3-deoxy-7-phosphoheptulonate synthase, partial [bacterium]
MIIVLKLGASEDQVQYIADILRARGYGIHLSQGVERTVVGAIGALDEEKRELKEQLEALDFVDNVVLISKPYKLVGRHFKPDGTTITVRDVTIGANEIIVMAGPCTVEDHEQVMSSAIAVKAAGAQIFRGGAYKPSTSPYSFHGLGEPGLKMLAEVRDVTGMPIITEAIDPRDI